MRVAKRGAVGASCFLVLVAAFWSGHALAGRHGSAPIVGVFGVGGILSEDGALWQYLPDEKRWMSIDEAFQRDGRETHILPLPVEGKDIRFMESWGFLVTREGQVWQYDLDSNRWTNIGTP